MEKLEKTLSEISINELELEENEFYEGFKLIEEKAYTGGTSIKYWM